MKIENFTPGKGFLLGTVDILIPQWRMRINGIAVFQKGDSRWLQMPCKRFDDGGNTSYQPMVKWSDKAVFERFRKAVFSALEDGGYITPKDTQKEKRIVYRPTFRPADFPQPTDDTIPY